MERKKEKPKLNIQMLMKIAAFIAFLIFLYHAFSPTLNLPEPAENTIYWFLLTLLALIFPYIQEIKVKEFTFLFREMKESRQMLLTAKNQLDEARLRFDKTRDELVKGYYVYLNGLSEEEQEEKKIYLTKLYLEGISLSEKELMNMLNSVPSIRCDDTNEITANTLEIIEQFQKDFGLVPDGIFGYQTYGKLLELTR